MKIIIEEEDKEKAQRLLRCDECFSLVWDISEKLRSYKKHDTEKTKDEIIDELSEIIWEDNILNIFS